MSFKMSTLTQIHFFANVFIELFQFVKDPTRTIIILVPQ